MDSSWKDRVHPWLVPMVLGAAVLFIGTQISGCGAKVRDDPPPRVRIRDEGHEEFAQPVVIQQRQPLLTERDQRDIQTLERLNNKYDTLLKK